ncbi:MAG: DUF4276 family protein [Caldilineaceae bacterium]
MSSAEVMLVVEGQTEQTIEEITAKFDNPEEINEDPMSAPSKRLARLSPGYKKVVMGTVVADHYYKKG